MPGSYNARILRGYPSPHTFSRSFLLNLAAIASLSFPLVLATSASLSFPRSCLASREPPRLNIMHGNGPQSSFRVLSRQWKNLIVAEELDQFLPTTK